MRYPTCRYHATLPVKVVNDEEEENALTPASDGWGDVPGGSTAVKVEAPAPKPEPVAVESKPEPEEADPVSEGDVASDSGSKARKAKKGKKGKAKKVVGDI
jgi:hypothetical protein